MFTLILYAILAWLAIGWFSALWLIMWYRWVYDGQTPMEEKVYIIIAAFIIEVFLGPFGFLSTKAVINEASSAR